MRVRGPESQMDWLAVVCLWVGALLYAVKAAELPLMHGAPHFLASGFWNYAPLALISLALLIFVYRQFRPLRANKVAPEKEEHPKGDRVLADMIILNREIDLAVARCDERRMRNLSPELQSTLLTLSKAYKLKMLDLPRGAHLGRSLKAGAQYLTDVGALLRQDHVEEARVCAEELVPMLEAFVAGEERS